MWSLAGVLILAIVHLVAGRLHHGAPLRPRWLSVASGLSVAYVFVHILPELAESQARWLEVRHGWLERQVYLAALLGVLLALGLDRVTSAAGRRRPRFWLHVCGFALYNVLVGGFALRLRDPLPATLAVIAFGAHFLVNDHDLEVRYGRAYTRYGRWLLAAAIVIGWGIAALTRPPVLVVAILLGVLSGGIILNVIREELSDRRVGRFAAFASGAVGYAALLLVIEYTVSGQAPSQV